jgi:hypothetical protein
MKMTIETLGKMSHFVGTLHPQAIKEVLVEMNLEILRGFDLDLPAILDLFPPEKVIENIGMEKFIETIGLEKTIETIGLEKFLQYFNTSDLVKLLASTLSEQERESLIEQLRQSDGDGN